MIYQFKTMDDELFVIDVVHMKWGRASTILAAPSVEAAEHDLARFAYSEQGDLVPLGAGAYSLAPRTPKTEGPGAGLSVIGIMAVPYEDTLVLYLKANAPLKPDSFKSNPITTVKYNILQSPTFTKQEETK